MWIKPNLQRNIRKENNLCDSLQYLNEKLGINNITKEDIDINFYNLYLNTVFTNIDDLEEIQENVDVMIFTGYAGCGHYAPARILALEYEARNYNVILVDLVFLFSKIVGIINCEAWKYMARYNHRAWEILRNNVATEKGSDKAFKVAKLMYNDRLVDFIIDRGIEVILSTYSYSNAILSKYADYVKFTGIVVPDVSPIGFLNEIYHNTKKLSYFVTDELVYNKGLEIYPYISEAKNVFVMGHTPIFFKQKPVDDKVKNTLLFIPGSGMGIGKAMSDLERLAINYEGDIIVICGDNDKWIKKAKRLKIAFENIYPLGYVKPEILKQLMSKCEILVGKSGGSMSAEFASVKGVKIIYGEIKGQEEENAEYYTNKNLCTWARTRSDLIYNCIYDKLVTPSMLEDVKISSTDYIVNITTMYL